MSKVIPGSFKNKVVASELQEERDKCAFDHQEIKILMNGGPEMYKVKSDFEQLMQKHPQLQSTSDFFEMTPHEMQTHLWKRIKYIDQNLPDMLLKTQVNKYPYFFWMNHMQGLLPGMGLHYSMFQAVMNTMCSEEQRKYWNPLIQNHKIMGCYAQTELGHGSNVAGIETTATLDKATDEFIIHSPTITSTKYWPGDLGRFSTHGAVFARLIVDGNDYGVNAFLVQFRDVDTFKKVKGFESGDLGPKFGYFSKDNGWARFDQLRIPRTNMLMGIASLSKEGDFSINGDPKVLYTTMMLIRTSIVLDGPALSLGCLKIALRYGSVRRQFATIKGQRIERKIIDYQTFQSQLTPLLAESMGQVVVGNFIREGYKKMMAEVDEGNFDSLPVMHHLLAGLKAQVSETMMTTVDTARRSAGGAGYQSNSGFTDLHSAASPIPTYEGDNTVMLLQSARFVFKLIKKAGKGQALPYPFQYISRAKELKAIQGKGKSVEEMLDISVIENALAVRALNQIHQTATALATSDAPDKVKDNELFARMKLDMIKVHMEYIQFFLFKDQIENGTFKDPRVKEILKDVIRLSGLKSLVANCGDVYQSGFFAPEAIKMMKQAMDHLIAKMRPQLIPLIEAISMNEFPSNIGNEYGDIYELQMEQARNSRMNKLDKDGVPPQWEEYIKPLLHGGNYPPAKL